MWFSTRIGIPKATLYRRFTGEVATHKKVLGGYDKLVFKPEEEAALAARVGLFSSLTSNLNSTPYKKK